MFQLLFRKNSLDQFINNKELFKKTIDGTIKFKEFKIKYESFCNDKTLPIVSNVKDELNKKGFEILKYRNSEIIKGLMYSEESINYNTFLTIYKDKTKIQVINNENSYKIEGINNSKTYNVKNNMFNDLFNHINNVYKSDDNIYGRPLVDSLFYTKDDIYDILSLSEGFSVGFYTLPNYKDKYFILTKDVYQTFKCLNVFQKVKQSKQSSKVENDCFKFIKSKFYKDLVKQYKIEGTNYYCDMFSESKNIVIEFLGDYYHGNLNVFKEDDIFNESNNITFGQLNKTTFERLNEIKSKGYNVCYIWESDWKEFSKDKTRNFSTFIKLC